MSEAMVEHCRRVAAKLVTGRAVPFLGAGVNLMVRPDEGTSYKFQKFLPSGGELAELIAGEGYPYADTKANLMRVAQYVLEFDGELPLYERLHGIFNADYPITDLHKLIASVPRRLAAAGRTPFQPLIVTTNYDDLMERALMEENQPFDVLHYVALGPDIGKYVHTPHNQEPVTIQRLNDYNGLPIDEKWNFTRALVFKMHGAIARSKDGSSKVDSCSFVITEDDYIDYVARMDFKSPLPKVLEAALKIRHFLFLGYAMRDWNLRVLLQRLWGERKLSVQSWAVQREVDELERKLWSKRGVELSQFRLQDYATELDKQLDAQLAVRS
jgi:hypothetical protein